MNSAGKLDDVSKELKAFPDYLAGKKSNAPYIEALEKAMEIARNNRE